MRTSVGRFWKFAAVAAATALLAGCGGTQPFPGTEGEGTTTKDRPVTTSPAGPTPVNFADLPGDELVLDRKPDGGVAPITLRMKPVKASWEQTFANEKADTGTKLLVVRVAGMLSRDLTKQDMSLNLSDAHIRIKTDAASCPGLMSKPLESPKGVCYGRNKLGLTDRMSPMNSDWETKPHRSALVSEVYTAGKTYIGAVVHAIPETANPTSYELCVRNPKTSELGTGACVPFEVDAR